MKTTLDIKEPGLNVLPPGVERHVVNGGGLTAFQIFPDDEIEIVNEEGNQICEIICFNKDGKSEVGILNLKENSDKNFIRDILNGKDETILATNYQLKKRNLNIAQSKSSIVFDKDTPPGEKIKLKSKDKCYAIFSAPGEDMLVTNQNPSRLIVMKLNSTGVIQWQKQFSYINSLISSGGSNSSDGMIAIDTSGNTYTAHRITTSTYQTTLIIKSNSSGTIQWVRRLGVSSPSFSNSNYPIGIVVDPDDESYFYVLLQAY